MLGRGSLLGTLIAIAFSITAAPANATVEIHSHNDPAGDPTAITYRIQPPAPAAPVDFPLRDGEYKGFGPFEGVVVVQALVPSGWQVADIQCTGPNPAEFTIDVPNGRVTMQHGYNEDQICSFTNRRGPASGGASSGVTPAPSQGSQPGQPLPRGPALLGVKIGRGYAAATVRITRRSVIEDAAAARKARGRDLPRRAQGRRLRRHGVDRPEAQSVAAPPGAKASPAHAQGRRRPHRGPDTGLPIPGARAAIGRRTARRGRASGRRRRVLV